MQAKRSDCPAKEAGETGMATLRQQTIHAIMQCCTFGTDKHAMKKKSKSGKRHLDDTWHIFSYAQRKGLIELASQGMRFIKAAHPEIRLVRDVLAGHWNEFLAAKSETCSTRTLEQYCSKIRKLGRCVNHHYHADVDWHSKLRAPTSLITPYGEEQRVQQMTREDFNALIKWAHRPGAKSVAYIGWELSARFGYRVAGAAEARMRDIHFEREGHFGLGQVHIVEKGKREREVDIKTTEDRTFLEKLIAGKALEDKLVGLAAGSINRQMHRGMEALRMKEKYPLTAEHSIRKLYAQELWNQCRSEGMSPQDCISYCNAQLGHSQTRNVELLKRYVHDMT